MAYNPRYKYDKSGKLEGKIESYEDAAARSQIYVILIKLFARLTGNCVASRSSFKWTTCTRSIGEPKTLTIHAGEGLSHRKTRIVSHPGYGGKFRA